MHRVWLTYCILLATAIGFVEPSNDDLGLMEWEKLVKKAVRELRTKRSARESESSIRDLQGHYSSAFEEMNLVASLQEDGLSTGDIQEPVRGRYIVMLSDQTSEGLLDRTISILKSANADSEGRLVAQQIKPFRMVGKGFTATLGRRVVVLLKQHPQHFAVEQDMALKRDSNDDMVKQESRAYYSSIPWNLDRLDQHKNKLDGAYNPMGTGQGVDVYILDTGIRYSHEDLEGRAHYAGYDAIDELVGTTQKGEDCNSHGTHCAGTVGGKKFGVAKKANLYAARVLDCTGTGAVSGIIHTMEYIIDSRKKERKTNTAVLSMSLGVEKSEAFNAAANNAVRKGIVVVSASGNQGQDSCDYSPGSAELAISVAASDISDRAVSFSNLGHCVSIFAPGASIQSASNRCDDCTMTKSGTSMACPHAAGYAAILLGMNPEMTAHTLKNALSRDATKGAIALGGDGMAASIQLNTPNLLLFVPNDNDKY